MKKQIIIAAMLMFALPDARANDYVSHEKFNEVLRLKNIEGKQEEALKLADQLEGEVEAGSPLGDDLRQVIVDLSKGKNQKFDLEKAIKYATGTKTEIYCKDIGLVESEGKHNDGTVSKLVLVKNNRKLAPGSYSVMIGGDYVYELKNAYRKPTLSDIMVTGSESNLRIMEIRERDGKRPDTGTYIARWSGKDMDSSYSTRGEVFEPLPMYMASDYHLWGTQDFGYKIEFKSGAVQKTKARDSAGSKELFLKSTRTVGTRMPDYSSIDSKSNVYNYTDCYPVNTIIEIDEIKDHNK